MNKTLYLLLGAAAGAAATFLYLNPNTLDSARGRLGNNSLDDAADSVTRWGSKQRVAGTGTETLGKIKQRFGEATGNEEVANDGVFDRVKGAAKDAAGQLAHAAVDAVHEASK